MRGVFLPVTSHTFSARSAGNERESFMQLLFRQLLNTTSLAGMRERFVHFWRCYHVVHIADNLRQRALSCSTPNRRNFILPTAPPAQG